MCDLPGSTSALWNAHSRNFTCRAAEDLGLRQLLSPPSHVGLELDFYPCALCYPGKAAALPGARSPARAVASEVAAQVELCSAPFPVCSGHSPSSPHAALPQPHRSCCSMHLLWMCSRWESCIYLSAVQAFFPVIL